MFALIRAGEGASVPSAGGGQAADLDRLNLPPEMGWKDWQLARDQRAPRARVQVFVPSDQTPTAAKVRVMIAQTPKPAFDSPQKVLDSLAQAAQHQCHKINTDPLRKKNNDIIFEMRAYGCSGQTGARYLLQRIAFIRDWELQVTYAPMVPTDKLSPLERKQALKLLASVSLRAR